MMKNLSHTIRKFNRFELKYLITLRQAEQLKSALNAFLIPDENGSDMTARTLKSTLVTVSSLRAVAVVALATTSLAPAPAQSSGEGEAVRRLPMIANWRKEKWSSEQMLELVQRRPDAVLSLGNVTSGPTGDTPRRFRDLRRTVDRRESARVADKNRPSVWADRFSFY